MRLRIASIAFLLGSVSTGVAWLTLFPPLLRLIEGVRRLAPPGGPEQLALARVRGLLPFYLALDLVVLSALCYAVLYLSVGRPLRRAEESIDQLSRLDLAIPLAPSGGPLLARLQGALRRMTEALAREQRLTRNQVDDLTAANAQLRRAQTELAASERLATVGKLAAGIAHEVGNPLSGILGYLSVARSRVQGPELIDLVDRIGDEVQRIDQIVRGLLELGRPSRGKSVPVELAPLVSSCAKLLGAGPDFAAVTIDLQLSPEAIARAEPGPLSQVVINLLLNAAQAMDGKGQIFVRARTRGEHIELEVEDSGPGMPAEVLSHLFEPFFTSKAAGKGTGLGLAVSRHLISTMGGQLVGANAAKGGARFTVTLPAVRA